MGRYDVLWKGMFEEVGEDLLRFIFPDADRDLDLKRGIEFLDKELEEIYPEPEKEGHTRIADKIFKVFLKDGGERWMLVHVEVQGGRDSEFAKRMLTYYYRILDRHNRPMTAIAIFTGEDGKNMPNRYEDHFMGTHLVYQYNTLCLTDYSDGDLAASNNPFAVVLIVAKERLLYLQEALTDEEFDRELLRQKLLVVSLLLDKKIFGEKKIAAIMRFLNNYVHFKKPETNRIFRIEVDKKIGKNNIMGIHEQVTEIKVQEALEEGNRRLRASQEQSVKAFLCNTEFSVEKIASLVGVSVSFVEQVKGSLRNK
jgi:hypothetical protein